MANQDIFEPVVPETGLHESFAYIARSRSHAPARETIRRAYGLLPKPDKNFVRDFQTAGFDHRIWELYLAAYFDSIRLKIRQPEQRPDFLLNDGSNSVWVEAATSNPTEGKPLKEPDDHWEEQDLLGIKLGSPLWSKLTKRYWDLEHVKGKPFVLALSGFHNASPLRMSTSALARYLYGNQVNLESGEGQIAHWTLENLEEIRAGSKVVPAGFFRQPTVENVSAVLFSDAGTVAKFNRMGFDRAKHPNVHMLRMGLCVDHDLRAIIPEPFAYVVGDAPETWGQEVVVYHNPNAALPVPEDFFGKVTEYWMVNNRLQNLAGEFCPLVQITKTVSITDGDADIDDELRQAGRKWVLAIHKNRAEFEKRHRQVLKEGALRVQASKAEDDQLG